MQVHGAAAGGVGGRHGHLAGRLFYAMRQSKGKSDRLVPEQWLWPPNACPDLISIMRWWLELRRALGGSDLMWQLPWEPKPPRASDIAVSLERCLSRAGSRAPSGFKWTHHSLRKGAASECNALGVPISKIKRMGDWGRKSRVCEDRYIAVECDQATPGGQRFFGWLRPSPAVDLAHVPIGPATTSVEGVVAVPSDRVVGLRT